MKQLLTAGLLVISTLALGQDIVGGSNPPRDPFQFELLTMKQTFNGGRSARFSTPRGRDAYLHCLQVDGASSFGIHHYNALDEKIVFSFRNRAVCNTILACGINPSRRSGIKVTVDRTTRLIARFEIPSECELDPWAR